MLVTIQEDEKTAKCTQGKYWEIAGLKFKRPKELKDDFYDTDSIMFKSVCIKGHTSNAVIVSGNKIHLT